MEDIFLTKGIDKATPKLMEAVAKGTIIPVVRIHFQKNVVNDPNARDYIRYELKNVMITSYQTSVIAGGLEEDSLTLSYEEIKMTYTEFDEEGTIKGNVQWSWKVETAES